MGQRGTKFKKDQLAEAITASYQVRIDSAKADLERLQAFDIDRARQAWCEKCNLIIIRLFKKIDLNNIEDADYQHYLFPDIPKAPSKWDLKRAQDAVDLLEGRRERTLALVPAFVEDSDGNVTLTAYDFKRLGFGDV